MTSPRDVAKFHAEYDQHTDDRIRLFRAVADLIATKRHTAGAPPSSPTATFHHLDYREPLPIEASSVDLLVSLYSGFISEHCADLLAPGGSLLVNASHGDAAIGYTRSPFAYLLTKIK